MAIEIVDGTHAWKTAAKNKLSKYPGLKNKERLYPLASPESKPSFEFSQDTPIFAVGSCFAANVSRSLRSASFNVINNKVEIPEGLELEGSNIFRKYTLPSIVNEIRWALDPESPFPEDSLIEIDDNKWRDLQINGVVLTGERESVLEFRRRYTEQFSKVKDAEVFVVTLGYVETWYDHEYGIYLNSTATMPICRKHPGRFTFEVLDYQQILDGLNELRELLKKFCNKNIRILVTVSPVPLLSTFRNCDVIVANSYSKSVQRAAVEVFSQHDDVDYFPSYETVVVSEPGHVWGKADFRHVSADAVDHIMSNVLRNYSGVDVQPVGAILNKAKELIKSGELEKAESMLDDIADFEVEIEDIAIFRGVAKCRLNKYKEAISLLEPIFLKNNSKRIPIEYLIRSKHSTSSDGVQDLLGIHERNFPDRESFRKRYS